MSDKEHGPLEEAIRTGEVRCPIRQGVIAIGSCLTLSVGRSDRCNELRCGYWLFRSDFESELDKAMEPVRKPRRKTKTNKQPGKRPWLKRGPSTS